MGGSSSRTTSTNTTQDFTTNNVDNRIAEGDAKIGGNVNLNAQDSSVGNVSITTTDHGALDTASDLAEIGLNAASSAFESASMVANDALEVANKAAEDDSSETLKYLVVGLTIVGLAFAAYSFKR